MEPTTLKLWESQFTVTAAFVAYISVVRLKDRLYSEEELPNEFKLFIPQAQKNKKAVNATLSAKQGKENQNQSQVGESARNKSEIPEESIQQEIVADDGDHAEQGIIEESANVE